MKRVTFSIGLKDSEGAAMPPWEILEHQAETRHGLAKAFGGYTQTQAKGGWIDPEGHEFEEDSLVFNCLLDSSKTGEVRPMAEWLAGLWRQQAVMVTTEPVESIEYVEQRSKAA